MTDTDNLPDEIPENATRLVESYLRDLETNLAAFRAAVDGNAPLKGNILVRARETKRAATRAHEFLSGLAGK